jgi:hypothetical protein
MSVKLHQVVAVSLTETFDNLKLLNIYAPLRNGYVKLRCGSNSDEGKAILRLRFC